MRKINIPILIKNFFDLLFSVNQISALAGPLFITLYLKDLLKNKLSLLAIIILAFAVVIEPTGNSIRIIFSALLFQLFLVFIKENRQICNKTAYLIIMILCIAIFFGLFNKNFYIYIFTGPKYKFIYNDTNNFGPYACCYMAAMMVFLSQQQKIINKSILFVLIVTTFYAIYLSQSRMYFALATIICFLFLTRRYSGWKFFFIIIIVSIGLSIVYILMLKGMETRLLYFGLSGREILWNAFFEFIKNQPYKCIYGSNFNEFKLFFNLNYEFTGGHSLTENSYFAAIITSGYLGLLLLICFQIKLLFLLHKKKLYRVICYAICYYCIIFFDDSFIYTISIFHQLFTIYLLTLLFKKEKVLVPISQINKGLS